MSSTISLSTISSRYPLPRSTRPRTGRPRTGVSTIAGVEAQDVVCAISESRGAAPTVGLAFVNLETCESVLCQISDTQTYVRTLQKLYVFGPSEILLVMSAAKPKSKLFSVLEEHLQDLNCALTLLDRSYWNEAKGHEDVEHLTLGPDLHTVKSVLTNQFFATCCFAACIQYIARARLKSFPDHSLRIKYEPPEGSMMIDASTIRYLELIQNLQEPKSKNCLYGFLNHTKTPMGARLLRSNILQPLTDIKTLELRFSALAELTSREEMFFSVRKALKEAIDGDKLLTSLIVIPSQPSLPYVEQSLNNIIMLKDFVATVPLVHEALETACSPLIRDIRELCAPSNIQPVVTLLQEHINEDTQYAKTPLDLRNQRTFAVRSGVNGLLDVSRQTFKENTEDVQAYCESLCDETGLSLQLKYDSIRQYFFRFNSSDLKGRPIPTSFINVVRSKGKIECSTLDLAKYNQNTADSHNECILLSDAVVQNLIVQVREHASALLKVCEGFAILDMLCGFAQIVTTNLNEFVRPRFNQTLAVEKCRHPIKDQLHAGQYVPNDIYASEQSRFQIVTGSNMSGKSTYIRMVALITVMAQVGCFVPAGFASLRIQYQLFAGISVDDCGTEATTSTFAAEMRGAAFILRNIDSRSMVIIDELGRGTSTCDSLAIVLAISEALLDSKAMVWFATHMLQLAARFKDRIGALNLHLSSSITFSPDDNSTRTRMRYKLQPGMQRDTGYGLAMASVLPFSPGLMEHARRVSQMLREKYAISKGHAINRATQRRRKLIFDLREHLEQASDSDVQDRSLYVWLRRLQYEFVERMSELDDTQLSENRCRTTNVLPSSETPSQPADRRKTDAQSHGTYTECLLDLSALYSSDPDLERRRSSDEIMSFSDLM